jgi:transcriptional regulator with XRE-family HTH domain
MGFGEAVREARKRRGMSQKAVAAALGWSRSKQAHLEAGRNTGTERDRELLSRALGVTFERGSDDEWELASR